MTCEEFSGHVIPLPNARFSCADRLWQGVPSIECTAGGTLYATWYSGGTQEPSIHNYIIVARSDDGGLSWRELFAIAGDVEKRMQVLDLQFWTAPDGRLWCFWIRRDWNFLLEDPRIFATFAMTFDNPEAAAPHFSAPRFVCYGFMRNRPLVLEDGRWLVPAYQFASERCIYFEGADQGETFEQREAGVKLKTEYDETMFFQRRDGTLVLWYRADPQFGRIAQCLSYDGGRSWSDSTLTDIPNPQSRFHVRRLPSGRLLLLNNFDAKERVALRACLSEDDGRTWPYQLLIDGRDEVSYPDVSLAPDGAFYVIHDRSRPVAKEILCSRIYEEEILAGKLFRPESFENQLVSKGPAMPASGPAYRKELEESEAAFVRECHRRLRDSL